MTSLNKTEIENYFSINVPEINIVEISFFGNITDNLSSRITRFLYIDLHFDFLYPLNLSY